MKGKCPSSYTISLAPEEQAILFVDWLVGFFRPHPAALRAYSQGSPLGSAQGMKWCASD